ncbi:MAG: Asp23/Gls24 family envelope stress response protein [Clostridia bacterium]|nr:Asp23/Gls24 family envelope stress response protein [Clostridia bacterium]
MSKDNEEKGEVIEVQGEVQNEENQTSEKALAVSTEQENIQISNDVIAVIAGVAVSEVSGVASTVGGFAGGISEVLSGKKNMAKGIKVEKTDGKVKIDVNIIVEYGTRIPDVAFEIQNRVKKAVENMTGMNVVEVNVHVQGVDTNIKKEKPEIEEAKQD